MALLRKYFDVAQTFYVDPSVVDGARTCDISAVDLYFKHKPDINLNLSDAPQPAVEVFIAETMYGIPRITRSSGVFTGQVSGLFATQITTSTDATAPSRFRFPEPFTVDTDKEYAFIITYGLSSQFVLWTTVQGEILTGTTQISPGPSNKFVGKYYTAVSAFVAEDNTNLDDYLKNWRPKADTSLKFNIHVARYAHSGVPVSANVTIDDAEVVRTVPDAEVVANTSGIGFNANFGSYEYISFDENKSNKAAFVGAMVAYQNTVFHPGGYANGGTYISLTTEDGSNYITANSEYPNGELFVWDNLFPEFNQFNRIVVTDGITTNARHIVAILSNTVIEVHEGMTFANTDAKFMIAPTGRIAGFDRSSPFGVDESFLMLTSTSANSTVRFVNNCIEAVAVTAGGSGYDNSDIFYVTGYEDVTGKVEGGYIAIGNVVTNSSGGIETVYLSNLGCGFVNSAAIEVVIANSTNEGNTISNTSGGSSATFSYVIGASIRTEYGNNNFLDCKVRNLDIGEFIPFQNIDLPEGTNYQLQLETNYYKTNDSSTSEGFAYYVNDLSAQTQLNITMYELNSTEPLDRTPVLPSKSNEFSLKYANGTINDKVSNSASNPSQTLRMVTNISSNSDFSTVRLGEPAIQFSKYIINNDATNEHTDSGNAYAKGITKMIPFTRTAEDIRVYLTAYKPANTDIKVYARIYKNEDTDAFDDKNWTELQLKDGLDVLSSSADPLNYVELTYGFYQVPQDRTELAGVVTVSNNDANVVGVGTTFSDDLTAGDVVYMYQPLFPENHIVVAVESVTDNTNFTMDTTTTNTSLLAEGMKIEKLTYPKQAFNNIQNSNLVRYYNSTTSKFDGYESFAIKIVFLSDSPHKIPRVDDMKAVGVSA